MNDLKRKIIRIINQFFIVIFNRIFILFLPLKSNRVFFISDEREELGGNLKCMYDYLSDKKYEKIVSLKKERRAKRSLKEKIKIVKYLSTSKYILLEDLVQATSHMKVRKGQQLVQLWHGPGAFKKFGHSREGTDLKRIHKGYKRYTKAITSSEAIRPCYAQAFSISIDKVKATGFPRTDIFFNEDYKKQKIQELYQKYPFLKNKKIILFAPTYRGTQYTDADYDMSKLNLDKIYEQLKGNYVFIFKWHPFIQNNIIRKNEKKYSEYKKYPDFYYDLSQERDINDLLIITDILITDFSSVIFDYLFVQKPIIYFVHDLKEYADIGRGLYFPFEEYVYGKVAKTDSEMINAIKQESMETEKRETFRKKFMAECDGQSTKKTYQWIFEEESKN